MMHGQVIDISARIGDNSQAVDREYIQIRRQIWAKDLPHQVKLIALAIVEHMWVGNLSCYPSKSRLMKMVNITERAFDAHYKEAKKLFIIEARPGKSSVFHARIEKVSQELLDMFPPARSAWGPPAISATPPPAESTGGRICPPAVTRPLPPADSAGRRDYEEKEDSVPNGTGAEAPPEKSLREMIWDEGIAWLRPRAYLDEARLRQRVGRWVSEHDPGTVLNAISVAQKENPVSVMTYIDGILRRQSNGSGNWADEREQRHAEFQKLLGV